MTTGAVQRMTRSAALLVLAGTLVACDRNASAPTRAPIATVTSHPVQPTRPPVIAANEMQWDTSGGGQVTFTITRNGQAYDVHVTSYEFKDRDERFTVTAESSAVYRALAAVTQDQGSISLHAPDEPPRGSWTTLQFSDGERDSVFEDAEVFEGDLSTILEGRSHEIAHPSLPHTGLHAVSMCADADARQYSAG